ncbi:CRISPR-associated protein Csy3 [Betaproteobacteria bacterium]|nr:CRISPR-associated protein Csy3 [Betaproteobacteria bacterium]GHU28910.1 CRISPR-associated protein Csy3 [Betaproteobacteria bacterium]
MPNETALKTASVLAFERKLDPSDALFFAGDWQQRESSENWPPVDIKPKSVRGTISNRLKTKDQDPAKLDAAIENPNLQTVDVAALPHAADTLKVSFTLRVLSGTGKPSACNNAAYQQKLEKTVADWQKNQGFNELARRYAYNLANGRFLWRNRIGAEQIEIHIARLVNGQYESQWTFNALSLSLRNFEASDKAADDLTDLTRIIAAGLQDEQHVLLQITAFVRIGKGQEVFPSQELIMDRGRGSKSKTLYDVNKIAAIHSQKIGNAIRTIDTWYPESGDVSVAELGPIPVEPYGSVTTQGKAYRAPGNGRKDFYNLLDNWILRDQAPSIDDQNYVVAVLIRGGVFGEAN